MKQHFSAIEQALSKQRGARGARPGNPGKNPLFNAEPGMPELQTCGQGEDFDAVLEEMMQLSREGRLPADFDLQTACMDEEFAALLAELPAEAAVRVYEAEKRAEEAEQSAMQRVTTQVKSRNALPKSARGGAMSAPAVNYHDMDSASFRKMLADIKKTTRNGGKVRL